MDAIAKAKRAAAARAVDYVASGMTLGLGSGTTLAAFVALLGARALADVRCVATSQETERLALAAGLRLLPDDAWLGPLDLCVDGADEVDPQGDMIKGGGGRLLRERMVAEASRRMVVIVDWRKLTPQLGSRTPLPVAIARFGAAETMRRIGDALGASVRLRQGEGGGALLTEDEAYIVDCDTGALADSAAARSALVAIPGVWEVGLFLGFKPVVICATQDGEARLARG